MDLSHYSITKFVVLLSIITLTCGFYGYHSFNGYSIDDSIYKTLLLFTFDASSVPQCCIYINIARFLAPIVVLLGGVQVLNYISRDGWNVITRMLMRNHYVICGMGGTGLAIYNRLKHRGQFVVIDPLLPEFGYNTMTILIKGDASDSNYFSKS